MLPSEINLDGIVNNDYKDVVFGRRSVRLMDPDFVIERDEILQMLQEAIVSSPSAVDTQPFYFLIIDTEEGKEKIDDIMRIVDKDRTNKCSFTIIPFSDEKWYEHFDEHIAREKEAVPEAWPPEVENMLVPITYAWVDELCEGNREYLHKSVDFQAGLVTMSFMNAVRAHGYECAFMDSWDPDMLGDAFGIDLDRYRPQGAIAVGKKPVVDPSQITPELAYKMQDPERYRYPAAELSMFA